MPQSLEQLKQKYQSAIDLAQRSGHLQNVHIEGDKLLVRAEVPNEDVKNKIWNQIKAIDSQYSDLTADITINSSLPQPQAAQSQSQGQGQRTYKVQPGDTLSAIAQKFYGKASEYNKIFQANKDKMPDADHVRAGQELVIP